MAKKPLTPNKSNVKTPGGSTEKKQLSLMAFFKPAKNDAPKEHLSPLKSRNIKETESTSDKENGSSQPIPSTQPTLKNVSPAIKDVPLKNLPSSPVASPAGTNPLGETNSPTQSRPRAVSYYESDDEVKVTRKRRKVVDSDAEVLDGLESDFIVKDEDVLEESDAKADSLDDDLGDFIEDDEPKRKVKASPKREVSTKVEVATPSKLMEKFNSVSKVTQSVRSSPIQKSSANTPRKTFAKENEDRYQWLVEVKDAEKRPVDHPEYDSRTLYIPQSAWSRFTAFEKQYWEIKSKMWSTVVFFKKGKFYELYENDAIIANSKFDLKIAGGGRANMKLAGIPEMSFEYWAKQFISHGYKIAKVDQKESLLAKEMRGGSTKEEKIIKRELLSILTGGTLTDLDMISDDMATYCLSINEEVVNDHRVFGVAFVDTSTGELNMIEFEDDMECTKLDTLITQVRPKEVLCAKGNLCPIATKILKSEGQIWNSLNPYLEFWDYDTTLEQLVNGKYFEAQDLDDFSNYPPVLLLFKEKQVVFSAFGALLWYLQSLKLDRSIMTLGNFKYYDISKSTTKFMLLDGITLNNLEILNNSFDGGDRGTLFKLLNRASTPFGKRVMKQWVLHPLAKQTDINERYDAVDYLLGAGLDNRALLEQYLTALPDLERMLARIHSKSLKFKDFLKVVESFERIKQMVAKLAMSKDTGLMGKYVSQFPEELLSSIGDWEDAFDRIEANNEVIVPASGVDLEFDDSQAKQVDLESQLAEYLKQYKKDFRSHEIAYRDSGKEIFLIELPNKVTKQIPRDWQQMGSTAKVKRYWSPEVKVLVRSLMEQRELHKQVCETLKLRMYQRFDKNYKVWADTIKCVANLDCLLSLARSSEQIGIPSCRPTFVNTVGKINFTELRNPVFTGSKEFIPNDIDLGGDKAKFNLLTGANAAGKSTLMRTTALAVILSQLGCYIPAQSATLSPVDKIMTRLGANDNIMQGKSTFFVELSETKKILSNATPASFVILDELGRGGSSSDGYAIAEAVLHHLLTHVQPLGFFATHYGTLGSAFMGHPQITPKRMGIIVDKNSRNITFLYKLEPGVAPGSFGMNVASMCGIVDDIVDTAEVAAKEYEQTSKLKANEVGHLSLGLQSDFSTLAQGKDMASDILQYDEQVKSKALVNVFRMIESL